MKVRTDDQEAQIAKKLAATMEAIDAAIARLSKASTPDELKQAKESLDVAKRQLGELKAKLAE